jgi:hypothetical protein
MVHRLLDLRSFALDAIAFWEPRRLGYNLWLGVVTALCLARDWRHNEIELDGDLLELVAPYVLAANLVFCIVYLAETLNYTIGGRTAGGRLRASVGIAVLVIATALAFGVCAGIPDDML